MSTDSPRQSSGSARQTRPTAWTRVAAEFARRAQSAGVSRVELLSRAGLTEAELAHPDTRVPLESVYALLEAMEELSGDSLLHMRVTREIELASLEALAFAVLTSATFGDGLRVMLRFQRLFTDGERYELDEQGEWARLTYHPWGPQRRGHALMAEMVAVDILVNGGNVVGGAFDRPRVLFAHGPPTAPREHARLLGGVIAEFNRPRCEIALRTTDLQRRIAPRGQEPIRAFFERHLEDRIRALSDSSLARVVRDTLMQGPSLSDNVASLARRLKVSTRTLQRRLAEERTSVRELADEVRRARAIPLIEAGRPIGEVAQLVGFAETSAFHRAFRRWTGSTPEEFRRR